MDWLVFSFLSSAISLVAITGSVLMALAFWKLDLLIRTPASRIGLGASLLGLGLWLFYGMLWCASMLPMDIMQWVYKVYEIAIIWNSLWILTTLSTATSLLCLAWTLHHGMHPARQVP
ncbi:hypothetical protein [Haloferula sp. A504]|jgi:hypothetical protein|uniref:hypothetical protein n=1 Tax=Haloferula sp. A504 TaxID=3373601 RepID=UPI0031C65708|nr:hypothetical protein [Verrucomicrobiaceae bacterium E54]